MSSIYSSYEITPDDNDFEKRQSKLYLGIISMGELLYQKGAAVAEMNKEFMRMEVEIANMRKELAEIRALYNKAKNDGGES